MTEKELCKEAISAMRNAYSPYSNCKVGAALLTKSGKLYTGVNIENASYSATVCAERTAFFKAISEGESEFLMICVVGSRNGEIINDFNPCGICRQVMAEFCDSDFVVLVVDREDGFSKYTLSELLPFSFTSEKLK